MRNWCDAEARPYRRGGGVAAWFDLGGDAREDGGARGGGGLDDQVVVAEVESAFPGAVRAFDDEVVHLARAVGGAVAGDLEEGAFADRDGAAAEVDGAGGALVGFELGTAADEDRADVQDAFAGLLDGLVALDGDAGGGGEHVGFGDVDVEVVEGVDGDVDRVSAGVDLEERAVAGVVEGERAAGAGLDVVGVEVVEVHAADDLVAV